MVLSSSRLITTASLGSRSQIKVTRQSSHAAVSLMMHCPQSTVTAVELCSISLKSMTTTIETGCDSGPSDPHRTDQSIRLDKPAMSTQVSSLPTPPPPPTQDQPPVSLRRWPGWINGIVLAAAVAISVGFLDRGTIFLLPFLFVLVVPFEKLFPRHKGQKLRRKGAGTDMTYALASPLLQIGTAIVAIPVAVLSFAWLPGLAIRPLVSMIPTGAMPFIGIALFDLSIYWLHRWIHEVPFLWRFHAVHHSPEKMDWVSGFRNHPFDGALVIPPVIFLIAAGFSTEFSGVLAVIQIVTGLFLHANVRWRLRPLHRVVITPEFHHWHHANEPEAINTNYSVFLPLWDIIFGTYHMPKTRRPQRYGISEPMPDGVMAQLKHPLRGMGNPIRVVTHPIRSTKGGWRFGRVVLRDVRRSTFRRRVRAI